MLNIAKIFSIFKYLYINVPTYRILFITQRHEDTLFFRYRKIQRAARLLTKIQ